MSLNLTPTIRSIGGQNGLKPNGSPRQVICATRCGLGYTNAAQSNGTTQTGATYRIHYKIPADCTDLSFEFANLYMDSSSNLEKSNANAITVSCAIESAPQMIALSFGNGQTSISLDPGGRVCTTPIGAHFAAGSDLYLRVYVTCAASGKWPMLQQSPAAGGYDNTTDILNGGDGSSQLTNYAYAWNGHNVAGGATLFAPVAVWGIQTTPAPVIGIVGDSIAYGSGDTSLYEGGWVSRAVADSYAWCKCVMSGSVGDSFHKFRYVGQHLLRGCDYVIYQYGTNDIFTLPAGSGTAANIATMKANYLTYWSDFAAHGTKVVQATVLPRTASTDAWATVANQTPDAVYEPIRTGVNSWLRDTSTSGAVAQAAAAGITLVVWDAAAAVEVNVAGVLTVNGGRWPAAATADGIHPNAANHAAIAAAMAPQLSSFYVG